MTLKLVSQTNVDFWIRFIKVLIFRVLFNLIYISSWSCLVCFTSSSVQKWVLIFLILDAQMVFCFSYIILLRKRLIFGALAKFESYDQISDKDSGGFWELLSGISILSLQWGMNFQITLAQ